MTRLEYFDGTQYQPIPGVPGPQAFAQVSATAPTPRGVGDVWVNSTTPLLDGWDDDWRYPTLINGWVNYNVEVYGSACYRKCAGGFVTVRGLVMNGAIGTTTPVFYLDEGCRPGGDLNFPAVASGEVPQGRIIIYPDGRFSIVSGSTAWTTISVTFVAADL